MRVTLRRQVFTNKKRALTKAVNQAKRDAAAAVEAAANPPGAAAQVAAPSGISQYPAVTGAPPQALTGGYLPASQPLPAVGQGFVGAQGIAAQGIAAAALAAGQAQARH